MSKVKGTSSVFFFLLLAADGWAYSRAVARSMQIKRVFFILAYGQTNEKYKEDSRKSSTAYRKPITYSRASNFGSKNEM